MSLTFSSVFLRISSFFFSHSMRYFSNSSLALACISASFCAISWRCCSSWFAVSALISASWRFISSRCCSSCAVASFRACSCFCFQSAAYWVSCSSVRAFSAAISGAAFGPISRSSSRRPLSIPRSASFCIFSCQSSKALTCPSRLRRSASPETSRLVTSSNSPTKFISARVRFSSSRWNCSVTCRSRSAPRAAISSSLAARSRCRASVSRFSASFVCLTFAW